MERKTLYCPIRKQWMSATPEEIVRQNLVKEMIKKKGFPLASLSIEKALSQMPHLLGKRGLPTRRADLVCFAKGAVGLFPLLLIECKAELWTEKAINQVLGYNYYLGARFVALVDPMKIKIGWNEPVSNQFTFRDGLPDYQQLFTLLKGSHLPQ